MTDEERETKVCDMIAEFQRTAEAGEFDVAPWWDRFRAELARLYPGAATSLDNDGIPDRRGVEQIINAMEDVFSAHVGLFVAGMDKYRFGKRGQVDHLDAYMAAYRFFEGMARRARSMAPPPPES
jgi:hypothetical protein